VVGLAAGRVLEARAEVPDLASQEGRADRRASRDPMGFKPEF